MGIDWEVERVTGRVKRLCMDAVTFEDQRILQVFVNLVVNGGELRTVDNRGNPLC
jgi:hypothetical protein